LVTSARPTLRECDMSCMASDQRMSLEQVSRWPRSLLLSREEKVSQKTEVKSLLREWRE
jgi:hypothetical protein